MATPYWKTQCWKAFLMDRRSEGVPDTVPTATASAVGTGSFVVEVCGGGVCSAVDSLAAMMMIIHYLFLQSERSRCKKILCSLKDDAKSMKEEYDKNEETRNQLKKIYEKSKGGNKRSIYTKRILEIISNVDKQNMEIKKILEDTRQLQKEINTLEGQLDRCFSIADETLFRDAKKDDQAKKAYKLLALLHSECGTIVSLVNDTGAMARDIVDLEDNIKTEKAKRTEDTLKKIHLDLTKMQQESIHVSNNSENLG